MKNNSLNELQLLWSSRVQAFKASGITQAEFCKVNEYELKQFNYWFRKFRAIEAPSQPEKPQWISVNVSAPARNSFLTVKIGSAAIDIEPGFNKHLFTEVAEALSKLC